MNCYSVTTTATDRLPQYLAEVDTPFVRALKAGGATEGVAWLELMLDDDGHFYVLEMGYRMSGDLWALPMRDVCGFDTYEWLIDVALGKKHTVADLPAPQRAIPERCGMTYILWSEHEGTIADITGLEGSRGYGWRVRRFCAACWRPCACTCIYGRDYHVRRGLP